MALRTFAKAKLNHKVPVPKKPLSVFFIQLLSMIKFMALFTYFIHEVIIFEQALQQVSKTTFGISPP
jgi:hypothetical protein